MKKVIKALLSTAVLATMMFAMSVMVMAATPAKVAELKQTGAGTSSVSVEWEAVLGENIRYEVSMSTDGVNYSVVETRQSSNEYIERNLVAGKTYYVRVRAMYYTYSSGSTYGEYSDVLAVATAPEVVEDLKQTNATTSSVTISWTKSSGATAYEVCKEINDTEYIVGTTSNTSYTLTGFNNKIDNAAYIYVRPVRKVGTYTAKNTSGMWSLGYISKYDVQLVPTKVQNLHFTYYWSSLKEVVLEFDKTVYSNGYVYEVYNYKGKKMSSGTASSSGTYLKNITATQFYKVRVRSYVNVDNKTIYGEWSDYKMFGQQPKVNIKKAGKGVKLSWKKVNGAKSYTVYMSTKQKSGFKKIKTLKKTSLKVTKFKKKKIKKNKTYYVYVVANTKSGSTAVKTPVGSVYWFKLY